MSQATASRDQQAQNEQSQAAFSKVSINGLPLLLSFVGLIVLVVASIAVSVIVSGAAVPALSATSAMVLITASAVAIERIIEAFWTVIGLSSGSWWPMRTIGTTINSLINSSNTALSDYRTRATSFLNDIDTHLATATKTLEKADQSLNDLLGNPDVRAAQRTEAEQRLFDAWDEVRKLQAVKDHKVDIEAALRGVPMVQRSAVRSTQEAQLHAAEITGAIDSLQQVLPYLHDRASLAQQAIATLANFIDTFKDNPARRLVSIHLGMFIGLAAAGLLHLDLFQTIVEPGGAITGIGVALTGLVIGLGANPTHQVIRLLEEYKKTQKGKNLVEDIAPTQTGHS